MMHFVDAARDSPLLAELRDEGVLAPDVVSRIDEALGRPETGTLCDFLLAGAPFIPETPWLSWLIRRHGCHRFGRALWCGDGEEWACGEAPPGSNLPYRSCADGSILVAVLRPDLMDATAARLGSRRLHRAAATPAEIRALRSAWNRLPGWDALAPPAVLKDGVGKVQHGTVGLAQGCR